GEHRVEYRALQMAVERHPRRECASLDVAPDGERSVDRVDADPSDVDRPRGGTVAVDPHGFAACSVELGPEILHLELAGVGQDGAPPVIERVLQVDQATGLEV